MMPYACLHSEAFASVFHLLWWAVVSLAVVGCGDVPLVTVGGLLCADCWGGDRSSSTGMFASALSKARERRF